MFNPGKTFDEAFGDSEATNIRGFKLAKYHVLSFEDLITSKKNPDAQKTCWMWSSCRG